MNFYAKIASQFIWQCWHSCRRHSGQADASSQAGGTRQKRVNSFHQSAWWRGMMSGGNGRIVFLSSRPTPIQRGEGRGSVGGSYLAGLDVADERFGQRGSGK